MANNCHDYLTGNESNNYKYQKTFFYVVLDSYKIVKLYKK